MLRRLTPCRGREMIFGLFRRAPHKALIAKFHGDIVAAARRPALYRDYGVADSLDGRFELLTLHAGLLLRRLDALPPPGPEVAQGLSNEVFANLDAGLRETGVSDIGVPKKMKKLAEAFLGRSRAYEKAFAEGGGALERALARNVYAGGPGDAARLARYVKASIARLGALSLDRLEAEPQPFAAPETIA